MVRLKKALHCSLTNGAPGFNSKLNFHNNISWYALCTDILLLLMIELPAMIVQCTQYQSDQWINYFPLSFLRTSMNESKDDYNMFISKNLRSSFDHFKFLWMFSSIRFEALMKSIPGYLDLISDQSSLQYLVMGLHRNCICQNIICRRRYLLTSFASFLRGTKSDKVGVNWQFGVQG